MDNEDLQETNRRETYFQTAGGLREREYQHDMDKREKLEGMRAEQIIRGLK